MNNFRISYFSSHIFRYMLNKFFHARVEADYFLKLIFLSLKVMTIKKKAFIQINRCLS